VDPRTIGADHALVGTSTSETSLIDLTLPEETSPAMQELTASLYPKSYRLRSNQLFLTYPRCHLTPGRVLEVLLEKFKKKVCLYVVVSQEYHGDGTPHIHALVILASALDTVNARFADIDGYHGNYRAAKYPVAVERYVKKDGNFLTHGSRDVLYDKCKEKKKKELISQRLATLIVNGSTVSSLSSQPDFRAFCLTRTRSLLQYQDVVRGAQKVEYPPLPPARSPLEGNALLVYTWLLENFGSTPKGLRSPQLYLYGPPRMGKTLFCQVLSTSKKTYYPSIGEKYFDGFDDTYEVMIFDEAMESFPLTQMLQLLDGQRMRLPQRYQAFVKTKNIPIVCCSNLPPNERYPNCHIDRKAALCDRFLTIHVTEFLNIFQLL